MGVLVGVAGFEPAASCSQGTRGSTKLRYTPPGTFIALI